MESKSKIAIPYLLGTFLLSYLTWGIIVIANQFDMLSYETPLGAVLYIVGGFSPTIISCILLIKTHEVSGFKQILKDTFSFRQRPMIYLTIVGFTGVTYLFHIVAGDMSCQKPVYFVVLFLPLMILGGGLEEVGWRYLLQPELEKKFSFMVTCAIIGVIWTAWHLPLFFIKGTSQNMDMSFWIFAIEVFGSAFVLGLLRKIGKGIWPCVLFHALGNAMTTSFSIDEKLIITILTNVVLILCVGIFYHFVKRKEKAVILN